MLYGVIMSCCWCRLVLAHFRSRTTGGVSPDGLRQLPGARAIQYPSAVVGDFGTLFVSCVVEVFDGFKGPLSSLCLRRVPLLGLGDFTRVAFARESVPLVMTSHVKHQR